jgi:hypothetical protein
MHGMAHFFEISSGTIATHILAASLLVVPSRHESREKREILLLLSVLTEGRSFTALGALFVMEFDESLPSSSVFCTSYDDIPSSVGNYLCPLQSCVFSWK